MSVGACVSCCCSSAFPWSVASRSRRSPDPSPKKWGRFPRITRAFWQAWLLRDPAFESLRIPALKDPSQASFLVENLVWVLLGELTAGRIDSGDPKVQTTYQRAGRELIRLGPESAPALAEVLSLGLGMGPVAVEDLLVQIGGPAVGPLLLQLGRTDSEVPRRRAVKALAAMAAKGIPDGADAELVRDTLGEHLAGDSDWIVRSQCALALAPWGRRTAKEMAHSARLLVPALKDGDDSVCTDVVHGLGSPGGSADLSRADQPLGEKREQRGRQAGPADPGRPARHDPQKERADPVRMAQLVARLPFRNPFPIRTAIRRHGFEGRKLARRALG